MYVPQARPSGCASPSSISAGFPSRCTILKRGFATAARGAPAHVNFIAREHLLAPGKRQRFADNAGLDLRGRLFGIHLRFHIQKAEAGDGLYRAFNAVGVAHHAAHHLVAAAKANDYAPRFVEGRQCVRHARFTQRVKVFDRVFAPGNDHRVEAKDLGGPVEIDQFYLRVAFEGIEIGIVGDERKTDDPDANSARCPLRHAFAAILLPSATESSSGKEMSWK